MKKSTRAELLANPAIRDAFRAFGRAGGLQRAKNLTPAQRSAIGKKAAKARWAKHRKAP